MRPATGAIDAIEFVPVSGGERSAVARAGDILVVRGWAHQPGADAAFALTVDDGADQAIERNFPRPDVAEALNDATAVDSGFSVSLPTIHLNEGEHTAAIVANRGGRREAVASARFRVSPAVPLANLQPCSGFIESWTDEDGRSTRICDDTVDIPRDQVIRVDGWAADTVGQSPAVAAFALIGDRVVEAAYGFERPDVAQELGEHHEYCGFSISFPGTYADPAGTTLRIIVLAADGTTLRPAAPEITLVGTR